MGIERLTATQREKLRAHATRAFVSAITYYEREEYQLFQAAEFAAHDIVDAVYAIVLNRPGGERQDQEYDEHHPGRSEDWQLYDRAMEVERQHQKKRGFLNEAADKLTDLLADKVLQENKP